MQFLVIPDPNSDFPESKIRDVIFGCIVSIDIPKSFDTSHRFWDNFNARKVKRKEKLGLYEIEVIDNPCYVTLAVNQKSTLNFSKTIHLIKNTKELKKVLGEWDLITKLVELNP